MVLNKSQLEKLKHLLLRESYEILDTIKYTEKNIVDADWDTKFLEVLNKRLDSINHMILKVDYDLELDKTEKELKK